MKRRYLLAGVLILFVILDPYPEFLNAYISGSAHDFSNKNWNQGGPCLPCHTPHSSDTIIIDAPLWNHEVTVANFTLYSSPTLGGVTEQPREPSLICLSCHDGTVSLGSFGGNMGSDYIGSSALIDTDLSDDHPISIQWSHQHVTGNQMCSNCHDVRDPSFVGALPFFDGYVECSTCHDVHNSFGYPKLLRLPNENSQVCVFCHAMS
ncbi:MAG: cytochrome c3 family protein [Planctomycetota bacterium]|jgi:predicted CXXCH cytochrome family protein